MEQRQLVGLITRRSSVRIRPPQPSNRTRKGLFKEALSPSLEADCSQNAHGPFGRPREPRRRRRRRDRVSDRRAGTNWSAGPTPRRRLRRSVRLHACRRLGGRSLVRVRRLGHMGALRDRCSWSNGGARWSGRRASPTASTGARRRADPQLSQCGLPVEMVDGVRSDRCPDAHRTWHPELQVEVAASRLIEDWPAPETKIETERSLVRSEALQFRDAFAAAMHR